MVFRSVCMALICFVTIGNFSTHATMLRVPNGEPDLIGLVQRRYYIMQRLQNPFHVAIKQCAQLRNASSNNRPGEVIKPEDLLCFDKNDELFIREEVAALCGVYRQWLQKIGIKNAATNSLINNVTALYFKISELPIPELLKLLDEITEQVTEIFNAYEHEHGTTWGQWLYKFWWVPPTVIVSVVMKIMLARIGLA